MDTRELRAFAALAGTLHFGRAAESCNLSTSALSRLIQRLEHELGCPLFLRNNRSVRLTRQGDVLCSQAQELIDRLARLERQLEGESLELRGTISLYCSVTASYSLLAELLPGYRRAFPGVDIKLHTGDEASAIRRIVQGREDAAIAARPDRLPSGLRFLELSTTPLVFIAPSHATADSGATLEAGGAGGRRAWATVPMIVPESGLARERVDAWFRQRGVRPTIYAQVAGNEAIVNMVALGCGVGVVPLLVLKANPLRDGVRVVDVMPQMPPYRVGLCCRRQALENPLLASLWQLAGGRAADTVRNAAL